MAPCLRCRRGPALVPRAHTLPLPLLLAGMLLALTTLPAALCAVPGIAAPSPGQTPLPKPRTPLTVTGEIGTEISSSVSVFYNVDWDLDYINYVSGCVCL